MIRIPDAGPRSCLQITDLWALGDLVRSTPPGPLVELGVYRGGSAWHFMQIAKQRGCELHLFDTFAGIPWRSDDDKHQVGDCADTSLEAVQAVVPDAVYHVGVFPYTMPGNLDRIAFIHCDVDQVKSVRSVLALLWPLVIPGGIIAFDDWDQPACREVIQRNFGDLLECYAGRWYVRKAVSA